MTVTEGYLKDAMDFAIQKVDEKLEDYQTTFLGDQSKDYIYPKCYCGSWVDGFWPGMLMLCYEYTGDPKYYKVFSQLNAILAHRAEHRIEVNHHDLGFLYCPSAVADYKVTGNPHSKKIGIAAADILMGRYKPKGGFIQAWGNLDDPNSYALIIDCLLNTPLLQWATEVTGDYKYKEAAERHLYSALNNVIREDDTTFHMFYFDPETGAPVGGKTAQGFSDNSCWARGQAWGVLGTAVNYKYVKDPFVKECHRRMTDCFISKLPADYVPYWDMVFTDGSGEPRDTSAAMIAACGIMEMERHSHNDEHFDIAEKMFVSLTEHFTSKRLTQPNNVLLTDGMCSRPIGHQPEGLPYGDYYYMEYIMRRLRPDWQMYW